MVKKNRERRIGRSCLSWQPKRTLRMRRLRDVGRAWIGICLVSANRLHPLAHANAWCLSRSRCGSGLRKVLKEGESVPEIFEDPVVKRASRWVLSTSTLFSKHLREYGWGEVRGFPVFFPLCCSSLVDELQYRSCRMALVFRMSPALTV